MGSKSGNCLAARVPKYYDWIKDVLAFFTGSLDLSLPTTDTGNLDIGGLDTSNLGIGGLNNGNLDTGNSKEDTGNTDIDNTDTDTGGFSFGSWF